MKVNNAAVVENAVSSAIKKELKKFWQDINEDFRKLTDRLVSVEQ